MLFIIWLKHHLIPCPFKYLTGVDCPGCGFQRAVIALVQGNLRESFVLYPPAIPLLLLFGYYFAGNFIKIDNSKSNLKRFFFVLVSTVVIVNYVFKIWGLSHPYSASRPAAM